jgi:hypothetical protein
MLHHDLDPLPGRDRPALPQEPDDSIDQFAREVRQQAELERAWRRQLNDAGYKQRVSSWLADNVMVVDDAGDWCGGQAPTPSRRAHCAPAPTHAPTNSDPAGWRAGTSNSPAWASATCAPPPASTQTPPRPTRWR